VASITAKYACFAMTGIDWNSFRSILVFNKSTNAYGKTQME
jgi:hypothetical protein